MRQFRAVFLAFFAMALFTAAAGAQNYSDVARNTGYRDGLEKGRSDAAQNKSYDPERHDAYKDADHGYRDRFNNRAGYRDVYREAFLRGYREAYQGRRGGGWSGDRDRDRDRDPDRDRDRGRDWPGDNWPGQDRTALAETARNTGYRDGIEKGRNDSSEAKSYNPERHDAYNDADHGYRDNFGNKEEYKRIYRDAFLRGYQETYPRGGRGSSPGRGGWGNERRPGQGGVFGQPGNGLMETARNTGYRDGLDKGRNDARQRKSYHLERHDAYKDADHGYRDSFGNKEQYKQEYRQAFVQGYQQGYQRGR